MPFLDGTGPWGQGPMTGRGMGYCAGYVRPGYQPVARRGWFGLGRGRGWGMGRGFGRGRGWGYWGGSPAWLGPAYAGAPAYAPSMSPETEIDYLREEAGAVKAQLEEIEARIKDLESQQTES